MAAHATLEQIFTLTLEDGQAAFEEGKFIEAIMAKFCKLLEDHLIDPASVRRYHPAMAWPVFRGLDDVSTLERAVALASKEIPLEPGDEDAWWIERSLKYLGDGLSRDYEEPINLRWIKTSEAASQLTGRTLEILEQAWPEAYRQFKRVVRKIVFVECEGDKFMAGTGAYAYSAVFAKFSPEWNAINLLDVLMHENAHQALMIKQTFGRVIENLTEKGVSPLRKDERWLNGILHAAFVLWRVMEGLHRIKAHGVQLSEAEEQTRVRFFKDFVGKLGDALGSLREKGIFTPIGESFISQLEEAHRNFQLEAMSMES